MFIKRLCPAGKPFVETAVWRGSIYMYMVVSGVYGCAPCILLGSGHQKEQRGAPDFLSERRTQYGQLIIIAWAKEEEKSHSTIIVLFVVARQCVYTRFRILYTYTFCRKPRPCGDIFLRDIITHTIFSAQRPSREEL